MGQGGDWGNHKNEWGGTWIKVLVSLNLILCGEYDLGRPKQRGFLLLGPHMYLPEL